MSEQQKDKKRLPLTARILIGLVAGAAAGVAANMIFGQQEWLNWFVQNVANTVGQVWLRSLIMIVIPLVFASLALGVFGLGDLSKLGRVGAKTFAYFLVTTTLAVIIGLTLVNVIRPGKGLDADTQQRLIAEFGSQAAANRDAAQGLTFGVQLILDIVPRNPIKAMADFNMLALIFFSLMFGVGLALIPVERARPMVGVLEALGDVVTAIINVVMSLAPYGVFALIFTVTARFGYELLVLLAMYILTVVLGLLIQTFVSFPILLRMLARMSPLDFFRKIRTAAITAFSTSSSNATLPTSMRVAEQELGVPKQVSGFVLPLGATVNLNGTALFEGVTVLFIAQVFGMGLDLGQQAIVVLMSVVTAIGAAGVPGGSIPLLVLVLAAVKIPPEGIAIILGVDRILDMCRTTVNVIGDLTATAFITRSEGYEFTPGSADSTAGS